MINVEKPTRRKKMVEEKERTAGRIMVERLLSLRLTDAMFPALVRDIVGLISREITGEAERRELFHKLYSDQDEEVRDQVAGLLDRAMRNTAEE